MARDQGRPELEATRRALVEERSISTRLTRERDDQTWRADAAQRALDVAMRERDEARVELALRKTGAIPDEEYDRRARLYELLVEIQWAAGGDTSGVCPICGGGEHLDGHKPDCRLHGALEGRDA